MDATLVTVTVLSMTMAAALSAIVWRMLRLERQRSNARVAALTSAAQRPVSQDTVRRPAGGRPDESDLPLKAVADAPPGSFTPGPMFVERPRTSPWGVRLAVMMALAFVVASVVLFSLAARGRAAGRAASTGPAAAHASSAASGPAELELMSLHDSRQTGSLIITGLVQNPRTGVRLSRVAVTAYTFDDHGSFLASGRAFLDVTALAPGDESPFTVTVPVTNNVARYRIGFRDEAGRVISHVDRRSPGPLPSN